MQAREELMADTQREPSVEAIAGKLGIQRQRSCLQWTPSPPRIAL
jgi:DNA-directed RNA polymerase specialized sigma subunit